MPEEQINRPENIKTNLPAEIRAKAGPKDIFLQLLSIISLYVAAGSFVALIFQYINLAIPDPLEANYYYVVSLYQSMRWAISVLIIVFPVYVWTIWFLNRSYKAEPEKKNLKTRKWLLYFTLFAAAVIIISDLVTLVYNLLGGEFTTRFLLKVLAVLAVAGAVFLYYFWEIKKGDGESRPSLVKGIAYLSIAIVAISIVVGFFIVGSPTEERAYRFDDQRVQHLQMIQSEIVSFWTSKKRLPANLAELQDDIRMFRVPKDPENNADYTYEKTGELSFRLCANFARPNRTGAVFDSRPIADPYFSADNWEHEKGEDCFERTIDPERIAPPKI